MQPDQVDERGEEAIAAAVPTVGSVWQWEPMSSASERCTVTEVIWNGEEWWIKSSGAMSGECWNELARWVEATVLVTPAT